MLWRIALEVLEKVNNIMGKIAKIIEEGLVRIFKEELVDAGFEISTIVTNEQVMIAYFTKARVFLPAHVWDVKISSDFTCPKENKEGLENLKRKMLNGDNINPHLSRINKHVDRQDMMLYEWGIYHFHLGPTIEEDGYIQRTGNVLYAYIDGNKIYYIGVYPHGKWSDKDLIEKIHTNFPEAIAVYKLQNAALEVDINSQERKQLRDAHINMGVRMADGTTYLGPGMGFTSAGTSAQASMDMCDKKHEALFLEESILQKDPKIANYDDLMLCRSGSNIQLQSIKGNIAYLLYNWPVLKEKMGINV